jgi:hypothetical protein
MFDTLQQDWLMIMGPQVNLLSVEKYFSVIELVVSSLCQPGTEYKLRTARGIQTCFRPDFF